jgi:hypothetical protein
LVSPLAERKKKSRAHRTDEKRERELKKHFLGQTRTAKRRKSRRTNAKGEEHREKGVPKGRRGKEGANPDNKK